MWPFDTPERALIQQVLTQMAEGNYNVAVPTLSGKNAALSDTLRRLKETYMHTYLHLDEQREELAALINALPNAVLFINHGSLSLYNTAAKKLFALKPTDLGKSYLEFELPQSVLTTVREFVASNATSMSTKTTPNALMQTFKVALTRLEEQPQGPRDATSFVASFTDISQQIKTDALRKDFVAAASHELKTPVAGIGLMSQTARLALKDGDQEAVGAMLERIEQESLNLQMLVQDLLDLSRFEEAGTHAAQCDIIRVCRTTLRTRQQRCNEQGITLVSSLDSVGAGTLFVPVHEADMVIILDNLIDNAIAYTNEGGTVEVSIFCTDTTAQVAIKDSGIGIAEQDFERIFERFYRIDKSRSRASGGTGLGLSLVKHAVEQAGGSIEVSSQLEIGSTFTVTLPRI